MTNETSIDTTALQSELDELADDTPIEQASDVESLRAAIDARSQQWHRWIDELRVQADLGAKDAKEALAELLHRLEEAAAAFASLTKDAAHELTGDDLRARSEAAAHTLRRAGETALDRLRRGTDPK